MTIIQLFQRNLDHVGEPGAAALLTLAEIIQGQKADDVPYTVKQAAERMNVSTRKVYELCQAGLLRHTTNPIRITAADIEAYRTTQRPLNVALHYRHLK